MAYETTRMVLDKVRRFHRKLRECYSRLERPQDQERVKLLLHYMSDREKDLEACLQRFEKEGSKGSLETWFKYTPEFLKDEELNAFLEGGSMSVDELVQKALWLDDRLASFYRRMEEMAPTDELRDLFADLRRLTEQTEKRLVRRDLEIESE